MNRIVGRESSPSNRISWTPADGSFPMKRTVTGNRLAGTLALLIGFAWVYFLLDPLFNALDPIFLPAEFLMMLLVVLPGVFVVLYGMSQYVYHEETTIDQSVVSWKRRGLMGAREWREGIANYQGVLKEHLHWGQSEGSRGSSRMNYFIRLTHSDSDKDVLLYWAQSTLHVSPPEWLESWKRYAELLQLPVIEKTEDGMRSSDVSDLNEPLIHKIRDGKRKVSPIDPLGVKLGLMAQLERDEDVWIITCYPVWTLWKSVAGTIVLALVWVGAYAFSLVDPRILKYLLLSLPLCVLAIGLSIRRKVAHPEQLALDKRCIYYRHLDKKGEWVTRDIPLRSVYDISVRDDPTHFRSAGDIVVDGENRSIRFGWWLPKKTKLHIKNLLLSLIARGVPGN
jgi:hypothetical protein